MYMRFITSYIEQTIVWHKECKYTARMLRISVSKEDRMDAKIRLKQTEIESVIAHSLLSRSFNKTGLCAYCKRNTICTMSNESGLVFDCSDYEDGDTYRSAVPLSTLTYEFEVEEALELKGLCRTCHRQYNCALSSDPCGIWHCDDYCP